MRNSSIRSVFWYIRLSQGIVPEAQSNLIPTLAPTEKFAKAEKSILIALKRTLLALTTFLPAPEVGVEIRSGVAATLHFHWIVKGLKAITPYIGVMASIFSRLSL